MNDSLYMRRALELAENARGSASPNPMVGCVIVHEDKIIGEGYTSAYGGPHAEVNAVRSVADESLLANSTVYVTLEPCSHYGKTPPCADMLISKQVKRVVIACKDPFEKVAGRGIEKLENAGVEVSLGELEKEAWEHNRRFFTSITHKRPYIILKWAQTADGFIARSNYDSKWISNAHSRQLVHKWRAEEDAILVGKHTAVYDTPSLTVREWEGKNPVRVLLDSKLEVSEDTSLFNADASTLIFNTIKDEKEGHLEWVKVDTKNITAVLQSLQERKIQSVIVEGGTHVLNAFIGENLWDEARVFTSKTEFKEGIPAPKLDEVPISKEIILDDTLTTYRNHHG